MGWTIHPAKESFSRYAADWDRLNLQLYDGHPLFDSRFVAPLLACFGNGREKLCVYEDSGGISGALIVQPAGGGRWSSFKPSQSPLSALMLGDARLLRELFSALPGLAWSLDLYSLDPRFSPDFDLAAIDKITSLHSKTIAISESTGFDEYWAHRSKNLKANVRRYHNRIDSEYGTPSLTKKATAPEMIRGVARFGELESAGWKGSAGTAVAIDNTQGKFYSEVMCSFAVAKSASIYELRIGCELAASRLVISNHAMLAILKTTYNESLARFAPGRILLYRLLQEQLKPDNAKAIEFYTNATSEQKEWATRESPILDTQLFRSAFFAALFPLIKVFQRGVRSEAHRRQAPQAAPEVKRSRSVAEFSNEHLSIEHFLPRDNIETSIDWFDLLQKTVFPDDPGVCYYHIAENNRPSLVFPLRLTNKGRCKTIEALGNYYTSLYTPLIAPDCDAYLMRHLLGAATRDHGGAHAMRFAPMDPESRVFKELMNELRAIGWIPFKFFCFGNWYLKVDGDWADFLRKRSANLRSTIKRMSKKFSAEHGRLEIVSSLDGVEAAIKAFEEVYSSSWKIPEPYPHFVPTLIRHLAALGMLRLGIAHLRGKPIAAQLWIVGQNKARIFKVAYHEDYAAFSPGTVLTSHLMQHVIEQDRVSEVDFLIGDDKYKQLWMSDRRERWGIIAYNPRTLIGFALFLREIVGRTAKAGIQRVRRLFANPRRR